jgi:hypothetical protein
MPGLTPSLPEETPLDDGARMPLLIVPNKPMGEIPGILANGWFRAVFPFAPSLRVRRHECQRIEVKQPLN